METTNVQNQNAQVQNIGTSVTKQKVKVIKNPGLAAVASFFFSGLGQIYNGEIGKGMLLIFVQVINVLLCFILIGFVTYPVTWAYGVYDAYKTAERLNNEV
jgi:TM2 domain-containing membrane protein YozV